MVYVDKINDYVGDIINERIPACRWVKLACERHKNDLKRSEHASFPYVFDEDNATKICKFFEMCYHVKGVWAKKREKLKIEDWQAFILGVLFGWVHKETGYRRFREAYVEIARKNTKSTMGAVIGNYMLAVDGEPGAEVYAGATTEKQAWEVFGPARLMCKKMSDFCEYYDVSVNAQSLTIIDNACKFVPLIGNPGDGSSPHCSLIDEFHEHKTAAQYDSQITGMGARTQPLIVIMTTAGTDTSSPCYDKRDQIRNLLLDNIKNDEIFGVIYTIDDDDDWTDIANWKKANPNYGVSVFESFLKSRLKEAKQRSSRQNIIRCKHLNQWMNAGTAFFNMEKLKNCADTTLREADFKDCTCIISLDLASKIDLSVKVKLFKKDDHFYAFCDWYLPEDTIHLDENVHYQSWQIDGLITETPGAVVDYGYIEDDIKKDMKKYNVEEITYDSFNATQLFTRLYDMGVQVMVEVGATVKNFSEPMKLLEALVMSGNFHYDGDPVLTWCFSNVTAQIDRKDNVFPRKDTNSKKIDGVVAIIMALNRYNLRQTERKKSIYEERGLSEA